MKNLIAALLVFATALSTLASDNRKTLYNCGERRGVDQGLTVSVEQVSKVARGPNGRRDYVAVVTKTDISGTKSSGEVLVEPFVALDGGPEKYLNLNSDFYLYIADQRGVNGAGRSARISFSAQFVDTRTKRTVTIGQRWLECR
jgi:hypothetical protein